MDKDYTSAPVEDLRTTTERELIQRLADYVDVMPLEGALALANEARAYLDQSEAPTPISLADRQPTEADCDDEWCWFWEAGGCWWQGHAKTILAHPHRNPFTHWLPHWALPVPTTETS